MNRTASGTLASMVTLELSRRLERALDLAAQSRIGGVAGLEGNPLAVETRRFGSNGVTATIVRRPVLYYGYYNAIRGLEAGSDGLDTALRWFSDEGVRPRVTLAPRLTDDAVETTLREAGLSETGSMSVLYLASPSSMPANDADVRELEPDNRGAFEALWLEQAPEADDGDFLRQVCAAEFAGWRLYVALDNGSPAAYGCVNFNADAAVLASAQTRPESRGRGLQSALIARRVADATAAGCNLIISTAVPDSQSERNLRRLGFDPAYHQTIWG